MSSEQLGPPRRRLSDASSKLSLSRPLRHSGVKRSAPVDSPSSDSNTESSGQGTNAASLTSRPSKRRASVPPGCTVAGPSCFASPFLSSTVAQMQKIVPFAATDLTSCDSSECTVGESLQLMAKHHVSCIATTCFGGHPASAGFQPPRLFMGLLELGNLLRNLADKHIEDKIRGLSGQERKAKLVELVSGWSELTVGGVMSLDNQEADESFIRTKETPLDLLTVQTLVTDYFLIAPWQHVHRVAIEQDDPWASGHHSAVWALIGQIDVIRFLRHILDTKNAAGTVCCDQELAHLTSRSLNELRLLRPILMVDEKLRTWEVLQRMTDERHRAFPFVRVEPDGTVTLTGCISSADFRGFTGDNATDLDLSVKEFTRRRHLAQMEIDAEEERTRLRKVDEPARDIRHSTRGHEPSNLVYLLCVRPTAKLIDVIDVMIRQNVHRVFVTEFPGARAVNPSVVTVTDIMQCIIEELAPK